MFTHKRIMLADSSIMVMPYRGAVALVRERNGIAAAITIPAGAALELLIETLIDLHAELQDCDKGAA